MFQIEHTPRGVTITDGKATIAVEPDNLHAANDAARQLRHAHRHIETFSNLKGGANYLRRRSSQRKMVERFEEAVEIRNKYEAIVMASTQPNLAAARAPLSESERQCLIDHLENECGGNR